jgi:hypothetical protein
MPGPSHAVRLAALLLATGATACGQSASTAQGGSASNPLIGAWHLTGETVIPDHPGTFCLTTDLTFTPTTQTIVVSGASRTTDVTYNLTDPAKTFVIGNLGAANAVAYQIIDRDDIKGANYLGCEYRRVS